MTRGPVASPTRAAHVRRADGREEADDAGRCVMGGVGAGTGGGVGASTGEVLANEL